MIVQLKIENINHCGYWNDWFKLIISKLASGGEYWRDIDWRLLLFKKIYFIL